MAAPHRRSFVGARLKIPRSGRCRNTQSAGVSFYDTAATLRITIKPTSSQVYDESDDFSDLDLEDLLGDVSG